MITPDEALDLVLRTAVPLPPQSYPLQQAFGLTLAEDVVAGDDYPPFPRAMMDGFAVRLADAGKDVPVAGEVPAGTSWEGQLADGRCLAILTVRLVRREPRRWWPRNTFGGTRMA